MAKTAPQDLRPLPNENPGSAPDPPLWRGTPEPYLTSSSLISLAVVFAVICNLCNFNSFFADEQVLYCLKSA